MKTTVVKLLRKQREFKEAKQKWAGARGGVGSGKTIGAAWWLLERLEEYPKASAFVIGADYEQLRRGFFQSLIGLLENVLGWEAGVDFSYRETPSPMLSLKHNGARLRAMSAEQAERIRSVEIQTLYCEEPQTWQNGEGVYRVLVGRLRHSQRSATAYDGMQPQGRMTFNPPAVGTWLYKLIEEQWPLEKFPCWRFSLRDNVLLPGYQEYIRQLENAYPPDVWPVEIDGHWASVGGDVYRYFDAKVHCKPPEGMPALALDPSKPILWTLDFNFAWMSSLISQAHVQNKVQSGMEIKPGLPPKPTYSYAVPGWQARLFYVLHELFLRDCGSPDVVEAFISSPYGEVAKKQGVYLYGDASGSNRSQTQSAQEAALSNWEIIIQRLRKERIPVTIRIPFANPSVVNRIIAVNAQFRSGEGAGIVIDRDQCPNLVDDFYGVKFKPGTNEIDKSDKSDEGIKRTHLSDALGYMVYIERRLASREPTTFRDFLMR